MKKNFFEEKCVVCGISMKGGATMVFEKNHRTVCHLHQNYGKNSKPGSQNCGYDCHFQEPYGFVAEAGCKIHDY